MPTAMSCSPRAAGDQAGRQFGQTGSDRDDSESDHGFGKMRHAPEPDCAVNDEFAAENEGGGAADDEGGGEPQRIFPAVLHLLPDFGFRIAAPVALLKADVPGDVGQQPGEEHGAGEPVEAARAEGRSLPWPA